MNDDTAKANQAIKQINHLSELLRRITESKTKPGAMYMAQLMGMWSQVYGVSIRNNPFIGKSDELSSNWNSGWRASAFAAAKPKTKS